MHCIPNVTFLLGADEGKSPAADFSHIVLKHSFEEHILCSVILRILSKLYIDISHIT